ncbi:MAG: glutamine-synthetase adenylyltransferase, partial [Pseudomonadota bacterium]
MEPLAARIIQSPLAHDPGRAAACLDAIDPSLRQGSAGALLSGAAGSSPYLARLIGRHQDWLPGIMNSDPDWSFASLIDEAQKSVAAAETFAEVGAILRHTKVRCALLAALADLGGVWSLDHVTAALTTLADSAVEAAAKWLLRAEVAQGRLPDPMDADAGAGYMIIAMGKWGAGEPNYSSDIDLIALFDDSAFGRDDVLDAR